MISVGGYTFKNAELVETALTHSSYSQNNYERLEFLGDSILDFVVGKYFFFKTQDNEGQLTKKRAYFVSEKHLSFVFDKLIKISEVLVGKSCPKITNSIKCDIVEAIVGAIYIDSGSDMEQCEKFIVSNFELDCEVESFVDFKSKLQEYTQANKINLKYNLKEIKGQAHNPIFIVECMCGEIITIQEGKTKQQAQQKCAQVVLEMINKEQKA